MYSSAISRTASIPSYADYIKPGVLAFRGWGLERFLSGDRRRHVEDLRADIKAMKKALPQKYAYVHGVQDAEKPGNLKLAIRGNPMRLGDEVPRRFLTVLSVDAPPALTKGSGRIELADLIAQHPLSARVIVNRIWKGHFGTGIVDTPSNFGENGERPTNPELLEYLAARFVDNGRSIKRLHREIMLSAVYQLSDDNSALNAEKDSGNRLYWRASRRRMTAEQIRDSMLAVSGALDAKIGGPSEELTPGVTPPHHLRQGQSLQARSVSSALRLPGATISAEQRYSTSVPLQRLFFMNSDFMQQQGELLARRVSNGAGHAQPHHRRLSPRSGPRANRGGAGRGRSVTWTRSRCARTKSARPKRRRHLAERAESQAGEPPAVARTTTDRRPMTRRRA